MIVAGMLGAAAAVTLGLYLRSDYWRGAESPEVHLEKNAGASKPAFARSGLDSMRPDEPQGSTLPVMSATAPVKPVKPSLFSHLPQSRAGLPLEDDPFVAASAAEQRWLDRNGYPNAVQWKAYSTATDAALQQAAADGDRLAAVILDGRALVKGDRRAPDRLFQAAAQDGSMFALSLLQAYMAGSPAGDPVLAYSISRVLEMKGDKRIALAREIMFRRPLTAEERMRGEADAIRLYEELKKKSSGRFGVDPRPFP